MKCERCGSDYVQKVSLAYDSGITNSVSNVGMVGAIQGGFGGGGGLAATSSQSALSAELAPPRKKGVFGGLFLMALALLALFVFAGPMSTFGIGGAWVAWLFVVAFAALAVLRFVAVRKFNNTVWRDAIDEWSNAFICMTCRNTFVAYV